MTFTPRDWRVIFAEKAAFIIANSPISVIYPGSVIGTILEATSLENAEEYFQMLETIEAYNLDSTFGEDLDKRAEEVSLDPLRKEELAATSTVTISDSAFSKVQTALYSGLAGPRQGDTSLYTENRTNFPSTGSLIVGRGTNNVETIPYTSVTEFGSYARFNLSTGLASDHGIDETVILSQGGNRSVSKGTSVYVEENDISSEVVFTIDENTTLLDGENSIAGIKITATEAGTGSNVPAGFITNFTNKPFSTAEITNAVAVTNGRDRESDDELRDRIKLHLQSLSRGTQAAILNALIGLEDLTENKRIISAKVVSSNDLTLPSKAYIDDGTGFEPSYSGVGIETIVSSATGGEKIFHLRNFPLVKAFVVSQSQETYNMSGDPELEILAGGIPETIQFSSTDFKSVSEATAEEVARAINLKSSLAGARTTDSGRKVFIFGKAFINEYIQVEGGAANSILNFPVKETRTVYLYKNGTDLLSKDGEAAVLRCENQELYSFTDGDTLLVKVDGKIGYQLVEFLSTDTTAEKVVERLSEYIQGAEGVLFSNNTKASIISNKEASVDSKIKIGREGTITNATSDTVFRDSTLVNDFKYLDQLKNLRIIFTSGTYQGNAQKISGYNQTTGEITLAAGIGGTPGIGDSYVIDGTANGNLGNPATTTGKLNFPVDEVQGANKDYTLNRSQGQIELENILQPEDTLSAGSEYTRAETTTGNVENFVFGGTLQLDVKLDRLSTQNIPIQSGTYTALQLVSKINETLIGGRAFVSRRDSSKVTIRTNTWGKEGYVQVTGGAANSILGFSTTEYQNLFPHAPYLESGNAYNEGGVSEYSISESSNLVVVVDENTIGPFNVTMGYGGAVTLGDAGAPYDTFRNSSLIGKFTQADFFKDFFVKFTSGSNQNEMRIISSYDETTGELVVSSGFTNAIVATDQFVLIPRTAKNVADYLNSLIITGLYGKAECLETTDGKKVSIRSRTYGLAGSINVTGGTANSNQIDLSTDGNGSGQFQTNSKEGLEIGLEVAVGDDDTAESTGFITNITGTGPYSFTVQTLRAGGVAVDLSAFTVAQNAYVKPRNPLDFSIANSFGINAYSYYTNLLQKAQWTLDGKEDSEDYPGIKAAGVQIEIEPPSINRIIMNIDITTENEIELNSVSNEIKAAVSNYINNLGVGDDVILASIISVVKAISGVYDVRILNHTENIPIGDNEKPTISNDDIVLG